MNPSTVRTAFRVVAIAEAVSWGLLLIAMFCKWILETEPFGLTEGGVPTAGPIHGAVFTLYVLMCLVAKLTFGWTPKTLVVALLASIPPFFTVVFETKADERGLLAPKRATTLT